MKNTNFDLLPVSETFYDLPPVGNYTKKELTGNDCWALRYAALRFIQKNFCLDENWQDVDDRNAIQDDELYLNSFDGYQVDERYNVRTVFMTTNGAICADIYDHEKDTFKAYLID